MDVVVSHWNASTVSQIPMGSFIQDNGFWTADWRNIHYWAEDSFVYMDSDYLAKNHNWGAYFGDAINNQGIIRDAIDAQQSCRRRRWSDPLDTQGIIEDAIDTQQTETWLILDNESAGWTYLILKEFEGQSTQRPGPLTSSLQVILNQKRRYSRNWKETRLLSDTQRIIVGDAIDVACNWKRTNHRRRPDRLWLQFSGTLKGLETW